MSDFAAFARGSICSTFIDSVPLIKIARATSTVEMAQSVLMDSRIEWEWEDTFVKKFGVPVDSEVGLPKMIGAFCIMAQCSLDVEGVGFVKSAPPPTATPELQELKQVVEDQRMAMEGLRKELAEVSAKSQAPAKRKMAELLKIPELDAKTQLVYANLLALSTLLWRREVPAHECVSRIWDKNKFTNVTLDEPAPVMDSGAADTEVWCLNSMNDEEIDRLRAFVLAVWTFRVTSVSAYRGKRRLDPKGAADQQEAEDEDNGLPVRSQGCMGGAEEEVVARRLVAMNTKDRGRSQAVHDEARRGADTCYVRAIDRGSGVQECRAGRDAPLVSRMPRFGMMGALPNRTRRKGVVVLQPADFRNGDDVAWRLVWAAWRRLWKEEKITSVDALKASSWAKSTLGTCYTHYRKFALLVGYTPIDELETEACGYLFQLWGLGYSGSFLQWRYQRCGHWRGWGGYQSLSPAGDVQSGPHLRRWHARARDWRG